MLEEHIAQRREENFKRGHGLDSTESSWLFVTSAGTTLDESRVRQAMSRRLKRARLLKHFSPHSLRHSFATHALSVGAALAWVSEQLGHSRPQVTLDWYSWALPSGGKGHANLLDSPP